MLSLKDFELNAIPTSNLVSGGAGPFWPSIGPTKTAVVFLGFIISTGEKCDTTNDNPNK